MKIVEAIDAEKASVQEEIEALEAQIDGKRSTLAKLDELRQGAEALNGTRGGMAAASPSSPAKSGGTPARAAREARGAALERANRAIELIGQHPEGIAPRELIEQLGFTKSQMDRVRRLIRDRIRVEGAKSATRYFPKECGDRPSEAPAQERREKPVLPPRRTNDRRNTEAAAAHNNLRGRIKASMLELLADGPLTKPELKAAVLERIPEATDGNIRAARMSLADRVETIGDQLHLRNRDTTGKLVTALERKIVEHLAPDGATIEQVAEGCGIARHVAAAAVFALERRDVVRRQPDTQPPKFDSLIGAAA